jgi:hypothetical protein
MPISGMEGEAAAHHKNANSKKSILPDQMEFDDENSRKINFLFSVAAYGHRAELLPCSLFCRSDENLGNQ